MYSQTVEDFRSSSESFVWTVELPSAVPSYSSSWGYVKKALVHSNSPKRGVEELAVPLSVGKRLIKDAQSEVAHPSSYAELIALVKQVELMCIQTRFESLISRREYSISELKDKFLRDGYLPSIADDMLKRAKSSGAVSDERFAMVYIRSKLSAGWGEGRIRRELAKRGIDLDQVEGWPLDFVEESSEEERAYELCCRRHFGGKDPFTKVVRFLASRGYASGVCMSVARRLKDEGLL